MTTISEGSFYCMTEDDERLTAMCCHPLSDDSPCEDPLQGAEECRSVFGTYTISILVDPELPCNGQIGYKNCKDLNVRIVRLHNSY